MEKEIWLRQDLKQPVIVQRITDLKLEDGYDAILIGVELTDNGVPVDLAGAIRGYVLGPNDLSVEISNGTVFSNKGSIILTDACLATPGNISITIKIDDVTVLACTGYVYQSATE